MLPFLRLILSTYSFNIWWFAGHTFTVFKDLSSWFYLLKRSFSCPIQHTNWPFSSLIGPHILQLNWLVFFHFSYPRVLDLILSRKSDTTFRLKTPCLLCSLTPADHSFFFPSHRCFSQCVLISLLVLTGWSLWSPASVLHSLTTTPESSLAFHYPILPLSTKCHVSSSPAVSHLLSSSFPMPLTYELKRCNKCFANSLVGCETKLLGVTSI